MAPGGGVVSSPSPLPGGGGGTESSSRSSCGCVSGIQPRPPAKLPGVWLKTWGPNAALRELQGFVGPGGQAWDQDPKNFLLTKLHVGSSVHWCAGRCLSWCRGAAQALGVASEAETDASFLGSFLEQGNLSCIPGASKFFSPHVSPAQWGWLSAPGTQEDGLT